MRYTHRNGETDAPTTPGLYWFSGTIYGWVQNVLTKTDNECRMAFNNLPGVDAMEKISGFVGQWWGPLVPPWEQER